MRRFITLLVAVTAATLSVGGCSSDSGGGGGTSGEAGAAGETSTADPQCVGSNSAYVASTFLAASVSGKPCANHSDSATVCVNDMSSVAGDCGKSCLGMGDDAAQAVCVSDCINGGNLAEGTGPIGAACIDCYTADVECARKQCLTRCGLAPTSKDCEDCRYEKGCAPAFYACSGFPDPRATSGGGEGGAGGAVGMIAAAGSAGDAQISAGAGGI